MENQIRPLPKGEVIRWRIKGQRVLKEKNQMSDKNHLTLKWGTLKEWNFKGNEAAIQLLKRYEEIGSSFSAMTQDDTPEQKEITCKLIDLMPGEIYLSWDGRYVSKDAAKQYVLEYGTPKELAKGKP